MIKFENTSVNGFEPAIRGMRNPMNSHDRMDSIFFPGTAGDSDCIKIGPEDERLMRRLIASGPEHSKFRRMIMVHTDITAPLYWWKEFDTYKVGTVANSSSTMHKLAAKPFTLDDFSHEHLFSNIDWDFFQIRVLKKNTVNFYALGGGEPYLKVERLVEDEACTDGLNGLNILIQILEVYRLKYLAALEKDPTDKDGVAKQHWWQMIQLLPTSYNQRRTVMFNYEVLASQYHQRPFHKLDEWKAYIKWIEGLPFSWVITGEKKK